MKHATFAVDGHSPLGHEAEAALFAELGLATTDPILASIQGFDAGFADPVVARYPAALRVAILAAAAVLPWALIVSAFRAF